MHYEKRRHGRHIKIYLAKSFRIGGRVSKARIYLGLDLRGETLKARRRELEPVLEGRIQELKSHSDPLISAITEGEIAKLGVMLDKRPGGSKAHGKFQWRQFTNAFVYHTNAIEGSTVTLRDVGGILERGDWPKGRQRWEIAETYGLAEAVALTRRTPTHLSMNLVRELHRLVFRNSKTHAGKLRRIGTEVAVADSEGNVVHRGAPSRRVRPLLEELVRWYATNRRKLHPVVLASVVHDQFETIHPFEDGNGRVGRLLLNNILIKHGLPPVNIETGDKARYYGALRKYQASGDLRPTVRLILGKYRKSFARGGVTTESGTM